EAGTATNNGSAAFCVSGSTNLSISGYTNPDEIDGISIQWYSSTDNIDFQPIFGANSPVLNTGVLNTTTYFYAEVSCSVSNETDISNTLTVTVNPLPVAEITGNLTFCTSSSTTLTASAGDSYQWYDINGLMIGETNNTLVVSAAGSYYVEVTTNGCSANSSVVNVLESSIPAAPVVSGPTNVCPYLDTNEEVVYTIDPVPGATSYNWTVPPSVSIVSGQGTNTLTVTIGMNLMNSANKQIRVTASNSCGTSPLTIFYMLVQSPQTPAQIDGPTDACDFIGSPTPVTYSIPPVTAATSYLWTVPAGVTIVNNNGTSIDVTFDNTFVTDAITVRALNNCGVSSARSITVSKVNPSAPGLITGPANVCLLLPTPQNPAGISATYSVGLVGNNTYVWSVPAGATITNQGTTLSTSFIEVSFSAAYTTGNIEVYAVNGCGNSASRTLKLTRLRPSAPSGIDVFEVQTCPGRIVTYSLSAMPSNANYVQWTVPSGATILNGQGTSSITVSFDDVAIDGNVTATGVNGCQTSSTRTLRVKLSACEAPPPPAPFVNDGGVKGVIGTSVKVLDATIFPNPSTDVFRMKVDASGSERVQVSVFDVTGRPYTKLVAQPGQTITFGNELKPGAYLVELVQGSNRKVVKVIKN
ncbi:MAG TPA: T9SS type A sorting domain-containing protein, partial [Ferruginibacter sp.]|nr:T9SS type A sorting domain-containing protein [Ferruginibacter sp.]HRO18450.1 T9SS type A sorting domain-containing protein [Ferruginibacter sp.]HRQ21676.1 T9SS type A sorting domain-containing protein [Ferruginibacter sp.]